MGSDEGSTTRRVARQYEAFPYPPREPQDERTRLIPTYLDHLGRINHYGCRGRQDFRAGYRVLVAGGGTGDATVYLAEQLRQTDAEIVHLDLSEQSMDVARRRAATRGLKNVTWVQGSLLELPGMGLGSFDYVNCVGVLHHLGRPEVGLAALRAVLTDDGTMGLMVYARCGRTGVYQMQELMRLVNAAEADDQRKIDNAKAVLRALPPTNWFKKGEGLIGDHLKMGDAGIYDMFLHSTDRAYSIGELYGLVESCGLHLVAFELRERAILTPGLAYRDRGLLEVLAPLPKRDQQAALELVNGTITKHSFYASPRGDSVAEPEDLDNVPSFHVLPELGKTLHAELERNPGRKHMTADLGKGVRLEIDIGPFTKAVLGQMDGKRPLGEIVGRVSAEAGRGAPRDEVLAEFRRIYEVLNQWDLLLLRHVSVEPPPAGPRPGAEPGDSEPVKPSS